MIKEIPNFLKKDACDAFIKFASNKLEPAQVVGDIISEHRTAEYCWIRQPHPELDKLKEWVSKFIGYPVENQEEIHIVKYNVGGEYKLHHDYFEFGDGENIRDCGNRTHSFLVYLNDDFEGGETEFPRLNLKIKPELGKAVCWVNTIQENPIVESEHAGLPVTKGEKWILIIWNRSHKFYK